MAELETLYGTIERFIYQSEDNGFSVFLLQARHSKAITVKGYIPHIQEGQEVQLQGTWVFHAKFGKQFEAQKCISSMPTTVVGLKKYLGSGLIKGIGPIYAEKLVNHFGNEILTIIDTQPERLHEVDGIGEKRINQIVEAWKDQKEISNLMVFLQERGITPALAVRIYKHYKHEALAVLHENPYRLADEVWGVGFKTADDVALKMGFHIHSPQRVAAGILFAISTVTTSGHLYVELQELKKKTIELLELSEHEELIKKLSILFITQIRLSSSLKTKFIISHSQPITFQRRELHGASIFFLTDRPTMVSSLMRSIKLYAVLKRVRFT